MTKVVICRKWQNPDITITVDNSEISLSMSLEDYLNALAAEMGTPGLTDLWTKAQLKKALETASAEVVSGVKYESVQVLK